MFCALLGQDIRWAFTGPLVLWFLNLVELRIISWLYLMFVYNEKQFAVIWL